MNRKTYFKTVLIAVLALIFPTNARASWLGRTYDHAATVTAHVVPAGSGKVYVAKEATNFSNPSAGDWETPTSEGGNSSNTKGASLPVFVYAQPNAGYEFLGWSSTSDGALFTSSDYVDSYTSGNIHGVKKNYTAHSGNGEGEIKYDIYARSKPITYDITYLPGDHGTGAQSTQNVTITSDITLRSGTVFTPDAGWKFKEWKVTSLGSTKEKWALNQTFNNDNLNIGKGYYSENVTLTAQWEQLPCHIIIRLSGMEADESAIFTVSGGGKNFTVAVKSGTSVTLTGLTPGQYTVTPTSWSWVYEGLSVQTDNVPYTGQTFNFTATKKSGVKKHAEESQVNWGL